MRNDHEDSEIDVANGAVFSKDTENLEDEPVAQHQEGDLDQEAKEVFVVPRFTPVRFVSIEMALPNTNPVIVLRDEDDETELHIPIGLSEGVAIAYASRHIATPKPLTHGLFTSVLEAFSVGLETVRITDVRDASFFAELVLSGPSGTRTISCRPSDGICLALNQALPVPIMAADSVIRVAGIDIRSVSA